MKKLPEKSSEKKPTKFVKAQSVGAMDELLQELFYDMYRNRVRIYKMNFVRGLFYGFGVALGGTLLLAVFLWVLSWFVDFPYVGQMIESYLKHQ